MSLQNRGNNKSSGNENSSIFEVIKPITKLGFLAFQILQTITILLQCAVVAWGTDTWIARTMPDTGYLVMGAIGMQFFMFLWLAKLNVSDKAK